MSWGGGGGVALSQVLLLWVSVHARASVFKKYVEGGQISISAPSRRSLPKIRPQGGFGFHKEPKGMEGRDVFPY